MGLGAEIHKAFGSSLTKFTVENQRSNSASPICLVRSLQTLFQRVERAALNTGSSGLGVEGICIWQMKMEGGVVWEDCGLLGFLVPEK